MLIFKSLIKSECQKEVQVWPTQSCHMGPSFGEPFCCQAGGNSVRAAWTQFQPPSQRSEVQLGRRCWGRRRRQTWRMQRRVWLVGWRTFPASHTLSFSRTPPEYNTYIVCANHAAALFLKTSAQKVESWPAAPLLAVWRAAAALHREPSLLCIIMLMSSFFYLSYLFRDCKQWSEWSGSNFGGRTKTKKSISGPAMPCHIQRALPCALISNLRLRHGGINLCSSRVCSVCVCVRFAAAPSKLRALLFNSPRKWLHAPSRLCDRPHRKCSYTFGPMTTCKSFSVQFSNCGNLAKALKSSAFG